jgi:RNA polymerase sigma-70 factor (ECF subfamily)
VSTARSDRPALRLVAGVRSDHSSPDLEAIRAALVRAAARVCPVWLLNQRDDIVQVAMMRVMQVAHASPEGNVTLSSSYLWKAAHSAMVDEIRRLRRRREDPLEGSGVDQMAVRSGGPERAALGREVGEAIRDCLGGLVETRRVAVTLYLQGHSVPESARLLAWAPKKVENLVYRGLGDLRRCLMAKGLQP